MHEVLLDPQFHDLLRRYELAARRLRQAVIELRHFHLHQKLPPSEQLYAEKWRSSLLQDAVNHAQVDLEDCLSHLVQYGFALTPHSNSAAHLASIEHERQSQLKRLAGRGWFNRSGAPLPEGEEIELHPKDEGPPVKIILTGPPPEG